MTIQESLERAFDLRGTPSSTRERYCRCIHRFERYAGGRADQIGRSEVEQFLLHLARDCKMGPAGHNVHVSALKFLYDAALARPEVMAGVPCRKKPMRVPAVASAEDVGRLLAAVPSIIVRTILMLAYGAGLRVSEACALRVEDIDSKRMVIRIRNAKRGRERHVMLSPRLLEALRAYWRLRRPSGPELFPGYFGARTITRRSVARTMRETVLRLGMTQRVTPHTLRHGFATDLLEQGVDLRTVQVLMGHACYRSTALYLHVSLARMGKVVSPLDRLPAVALPPAPAPAPTTAR